MVSRMSNLPENPTTREVTQVIHDAGPKGILSVEIVDHFTAGEERTWVQPWVFSLLYKAKQLKRIRRSDKREFPEGVPDRRRRAYRWFITDKGREYLRPAPEPEITPLPVKPNPRSVLELLAEAGDEGMTGPVIGRHFTLAYPEGEHAYLNSARSMNLQRRMNWVNQILHRFASHGYAERGVQEISPFYHNVPAYRWFITDKGREYLASGMAEGCRARRLSNAERAAAWRAERKRRADEAITQAYVEYDPETTPTCVRNQVIRDLRGAGCTMDAIGGVFSLTRERVRQILNGVGVSTCRCGKHEGDYLPRSWRVEEQ